MTNRPFRIVRDTTGYYYGGGCIPEADKETEARAINAMLGLVINHTLAPLKEGDIPRVERYIGRDETSGEPVWVC